MYDYLIVGGGLFGSVFARQMTDAGAKCLIIEKRHHIAGNCYTENVGGINVHSYGPHIFHTNDVEIWKYVNRFANFNRFSYRPKAVYRGKIYSFPINLMTLHQLWGVRTPAEAASRLEEERIPIPNPANLEEWALSQVGKEIYETFIYGYTSKQWGRDPKELPASIIRRIPIRLTWNDDYFDDRYCGIPIGGYTRLFQNMLSGIQVQTGVDFLEDRESFERTAAKVVYTGPLDRLFDYQLGENEWRGLRFETETMQCEDYQGNAAINHTHRATPYTREVEHKHFEDVKTPTTVVTREYPSQWKRGDEMYYPINNQKNELLQQEYLAMIPDNYIVGGRLATYRYYDMHQVIASAIHRAKQEIQRTTHTTLRVHGSSAVSRRAA